MLGLTLPLVNLRRSYTPPLLGHDTVEKPPSIMGPDGPQKSFISAICQRRWWRSLRPQTEVIGDVGPSLALLAHRLKDTLENAAARLQLREEILEHLAELIRRKPLSVNAPAHRPRRSPSHAGGRYCLPGQLHL